MQTATHEKIETRCPSCGHAGTLFIGAGGELVCSWLKCQEPGVGTVIARLQAEHVEAECRCSVPFFVGIQGEMLTVRCLQCGRRPPTSDCVHVRFLRKAQP